MRIIFYFWQIYFYDFFDCLPKHLLNVKFISLANVPSSFGNHNVYFSVFILCIILVSTHSFWVHWRRSLSTYIELISTAEILGKTSMLAVLTLCNVQYIPVYMRQFCRRTESSAYLGIPTQYPRIHSSKCIVQKWKLM